MAPLARAHYAEALDASANANVLAIEQQWFGRSRHELP